MRRISRQWAGEKVHSLDIGKKPRVFYACFFFGGGGVLGFLDGFFVANPEDDIS